MMKADWPEYFRFYKEQKQSYKTVLCFQTGLFRLFMISFMPDVLRKSEILQRVSICNRICMHYASAVFNA